MSEPTEDSPGEALPEGEEAPAGSEDGTIELEIPQNDAKEVLDLCRIECRVAWIDCKETCGCTWCCKDCDASYQACLANCP